jgi:hypothetical protein
VTLASVGDLSSCSSPSTIALQKNVIARPATNNPQITLAIRNSAGTNVGLATTGTTGTGIQAAQVGPLPAQVSTTVTISESAATGNLSGYAASAYECWADGRRVASGTLTEESAGGRRNAAVTMPGQENLATTCTIFNSPRAFATVTLRKAVTDGTGANPKAAAGWSLRADAATAGFPTSSGALATSSQDTTPASGAISAFYLFGAQASTTIVISELPQTGFQLQSLVCTGASAATPQTSTQTIGGQSRVAATLDNVAPGANIDCTFTNRPVGSLTLVNRISYGSAPASDWALSATGQSGALAGPTKPASTTGSASVQATVSAGTAYALTSTGSRAVYVQDGQWSCVNGSTAVPVSNGSVVVPQGANVVCTVAQGTAIIRLVKLVQNGFPSGVDRSTWTITATPAAGVAGLATESQVGTTYGDARDIEVRPGQAYTLSESLTDSGSKLAYRLLRIEAGGGGNGWSEIDSETITPAIGTTVGYRLTNAPIVSPTLPLTGGSGTETYLFIGAGILALALALVLIQIHRLRRRGTTA